MFFKNKKFERKVLLDKSVLDSIITFCKMKHPNEGILILKGKSKNGQIKIDGLAIPPFSLALLLQDFRTLFCLLIIAILELFILILLAQLNLL